MIVVKEKVRFCVECGNVSEEDRCRVCSDDRRDRSMICVVEEPKDVLAVEKTREYRGLYHVLGGAISPIDGVGPDDLRIRELMTRLADGRVAEVVIATDPNLRARRPRRTLPGCFSPLGLAVSRLASGLPVGVTSSTRTRSRSGGRLPAPPSGRLAPARTVRVTRQEFRLGHSPPCG